MTKLQAQLRANKEKMQRTYLNQHARTLRSYFLTFSLLAKQHKTPPNFQKIHEVVTNLQATNFKFLGKYTATELSKRICLDNLQKNKTLKTVLKKVPKKVSQVPWTESKKVPQV